MNACSVQNGPLPPFGHLFDMPTYVSQANFSSESSGPVDVVFSAGALLST